MAIISTKTDAHWQYFLSIEADLERLSRFIEFHKSNYPCYSIENVRILLAAAAEVEIVCKQICQALDPTSQPRNIGDYYKGIIKKCQDDPNVKDKSYLAIPRFEVLAPRYGLRLHPWANWSCPDTSPKWWTAYNKAKHQRDTHYHCASLENVLNAVAGLFVTCLYLYQDKARFGELVPNPCILRPGYGRFFGTSEGGYEPGFVYYLDQNVDPPQP